MNDDAWYHIPQESNLRAVEGHSAMDKTPCSLEFKASLKSSSPRTNPKIFCITGYLQDITELVSAIHPSRLMIITVQWWILPQTKMTGSKHSDGSTTNPLTLIRWCGCETTWHDLKQRSAGQTELAYLRNSFQMTPLFQGSTDQKNKISCSKFKRGHLFLSYTSRLIWSSLRKDWQYLSY